MESVKESTFNPFIDALTFTPGTQQDYKLLVEWLAMVFTKQALAMAAGSADEAARHQSAISRLELLLSEITKEPIKLQMSREPLEIQLQWRGLPTDLGVLPDGLKSLLSWLGDLLMRLERIPWAEDIPITDRAFVLLLDEVEIHLHPVWQRRVVPVFQKFFPKAQIFLATHSPFVVASADAFIHPLTINEQGQAVVGEPLTSRTGHSYTAILREVFGVPWEFDSDVKSTLSGN